MIDLTQLFVYVNHAQSNGDRIRGQISNMRGRLNSIVSSNAMMGRTKESINRLITMQQIPLLQGLENVYWKMFVKSNQAVNDFMSAMSENEENAIFSFDALVDLECDIADANDDVLDLNAEYQSIYRSVADDISLPMPSTGAYESNYEQARTSLRNTRECLEGFSFDYDEIRELMGEVETYVGMLEGAGSLPLHSPARASLFGVSDFAQRMSDMHAEYTAAEQAKIDAMVAGWEEMHYTGIIWSLPEPMTQAEQNAFMDFMDGMCEDFQAGFFREGSEMSYSSSGLLSGVGTFFGGLLEKTLGGVADIGADVARDTSRRGVHFGRSVSARLGQNSAGRFVSNTNSFDRGVRNSFRDMSNTASRRAGYIFRGASRGLQILGAIDYFNYARNKDGGNVGRGLSFTGYMLGTSSVLKGNLGGTTLTNLGKSKIGQAVPSIGSGLTRVGGRLTRIGTGVDGKGGIKGKVYGNKFVKGAGKAIGSGLKKVGLGLLGVKAGPVLVAAAVGVGIGLGAKWLYNNFAPVTNAVNWVGDRVQDAGRAIGNGIRNIGRAINPFRRRSNGS